DDIIFAHENVQVFTAALADIERILEQLSLRKNSSKTKAIFFNAAGRARESFTGSTVIDYLGMYLHFDRNAALKQEKITELMQDMRQRLRATARQIAGEPLEERGKMLCELVKKVLQPSYPLASPYASYLRRVVNHRGQLKELDYRIAR